MRYTLPDSSPLLHVGQGADLFALPLGPLLRHSPRAYFEAALEVDDRFRYHDDVWISAFLYDVAAVSVCFVTVGHAEANASSGAADPRRALHTPQRAVQRAPPQFMGSVHGLKETWATALRRASNETHGTPRKVLNRQLGAKRALLRARAERHGIPLADQEARRSCDLDEAEQAAAEAARSARVVEAEPRGQAQHEHSSGGAAEPGAADVMAAPLDGHYLDGHYLDGDPRTLYARTAARLPRKNSTAGDFDVHAAEARWAHDACPFEETRHSCFFFGQPNADDVARRALSLLDGGNASSSGGGGGDGDTAAVLAALGGHTIHFIGDSVLRQLAQATMCRLRRHLVHDGILWWDPMKRRSNLPRPSTDLPPTLR